MGWASATLRGVLVFAYFVVFTVLVPDFVLRMDIVANATAIVRDLVGLAVWGVGMILGLWMLRRAQSRDII